MLDQAATLFRDVQLRICSALEATDGRATFQEDSWDRDGGGGGKTRVLCEGDLFEKAGVNWSDVHGHFPEAMANEMPGNGTAFRATGVSLVLHPRSPMVPTVHANFRCLSRGDTVWFGGGADLTPYYPVREDVVHFHRVWKTVCDRHAFISHAAFKKWCDEYFFLKHRNEARGVGGIFFDHLQPEKGQSVEDVFAFVKDAAGQFLESYLPIVERRRDDPWGDRERVFQLWRRGRYVEFNLIYDRGTIFGLRTNGRTESILMSLPPLVRWDYDRQIEPGSREADLAEFLRHTEWV